MPKRGQSGRDREGRAARWEHLLRGTDLEVVRPGPPRRMPRDPAAAVREAVAAAGIREFLAAAAHRRDPVTLVVNDPHRATGTRLAVEALVRQAEEAGSPARFRLLVATGSHAFPPIERRRHERDMLGSCAGRFPEREWHDALDGGRLAAAGAWRLHRWVAEGRFSIGVGSLEPHYFAGVTGAHKTLTIGVMSLQDIERNHAGALAPGSAGLALEGNPVFEGIAGALASLEGSGARLFAVNLLEAGRRLVACTAGPPLAALRASLPMVGAVYARALPTPADLIVARVAPPLDRSFYQADKGIKNVEGAVRDGGVILLDAACPEGVGIDRFLALLRRAASHAEAVALVEREGYALGDHKAVRLRALTDGRAVRLGIVAPALPPSAARLLQASRFTSRAAAARWALRDLEERPPRSRIRAVIVEDAGNLALRATHGQGSQVEPDPGRRSTPPLDESAGLRRGPRGVS